MSTDNGVSKGHGGVGNWPILLLGTEFLLGIIKMFKNCQGFSHVKQNQITQNRICKCDAFMYFELCFYKGGF